MDSSNTFFDVIIIGAGPAGATLARLLSSEKYTVLLADADGGREKVCGGLLSPDAQDFLAGHDIYLPKDILVDPQLFSVRTIDLRDGLTRYYRRSYMNVSRQKFDDFLKNMVDDKVSVVKDRCVSVCREDDGFEVVFSKNKDARLKCRYVVGADGSASVVRSSLFKDKKIARYTAIQQWFDAKDENPYYSCVFDSETSSGCSWIFFKDSKLVFGGAFDTVGSRRAFEEQKSKLVSLGIVPAEILKNPVRTEACLVSRPKLFGGVFLGKNGAFLIGEAAGLISPSSFEGISYAMNSAEALATALNKGDSAKKIHKYYKQNARRLIVKIKMRCLKRPFMYDPTLRRAVMKSGITSIKIKRQGNTYGSKISIEKT